MTAGSALAGRDPSSGDEALAHARAIAADWRGAGLQVGLVEHTLPDGRPGGCVLVARSPTRVLHCACRPATSRDGRPLWTVEVSLGRCEDDRDGIEHVRLRTAGTAVAGACGPAWRQVLDWLHGGDPLEAGPETAPDPAERWRGRVGRHLARGRSRLRGAVGRLPAPNLAGVARSLPAAGLACLAARGRGRAWVGRHPAPDLAGLAARLARARRSFRAGWARAGGRLAPSIARGFPRDGSPGHALGRLVPLPGWRGVARPLLGGGLVCLAGVGILVVSVCVAGWRFSRADEQAYRSYAQTERHKSSEHVDVTFDHPPAEAP